MRVKSAIDSWFAAIVLVTVALLLVSALVVPQEGRFKVLAAQFFPCRRVFLVWLVFGILRA